MEHSGGGGAYCVQCGTRLTAGSKFCSSCGATQPAATGAAAAMSLGPSLAAAGATDQRRGARWPAVAILGLGIVVVVSWFLPWADEIPILDTSLLEPSALLSVAPLVLFALGCLGIGLMRLSDGALGSSAAGVVLGIAATAGAWLAALVVQAVLGGFEGSFGFGLWTQVVALLAGLVISVMEIGPSTAVSG